MQPRLNFNLPACSKPETCVPSFFVNPQSKEFGKLLLILISDFLCIHYGGSKINFYERPRNFKVSNSFSLFSFLSGGSQMECYKDD